MAVFTLEDVSFAYQGAEQAPVLSHLSFTLEQGEFLLLCGPTGGGKSTLLRLMKQLAAPRGTRSGAIMYQGMPVDKVSPARLASEIGYVFQNVDSQIVSDYVDQELAFVLENQGMPPRMIASRIAETASFFGMEEYFEGRTDALSGGEKQLLNLAAVLAAEPEVLLLDEPLSQLDPIARQDFLAQLHRINRELGVTVLLSEHHLEEVFPACDRVLVLDHGSALFCGNPQKAAEVLLGQNHPMALALPAAARISWALRPQFPPPLDARCFRAQWKAGGLCLRQAGEKKAPAHAEAVFVCKELSFGYERGRMVLSDLNLTVNRGECLAIIGGNGAGKSTLLHLLSGNARPLAGKIKRPAFGVGYLPQNPYTSFLSDTLKDELRLLLQRTGQPEERMEEELDKIPFFSSLRENMEQNPMDLSGGEAQKAALLKLLLAKAACLLLDEPTKGLDAEAKEALLLLLFALKEQGITVVLVSHDLEFAARCADQCAFLFRGAIAASGPARDVFASCSFYTTAVRRMTRGLLEGAVTAEDVEAKP